VAQLELKTKTYQRLTGLTEGTVAKGRVQEAETDQAAGEIAVHRAIQTLLNLGLPITFDAVRGKSREDVSRQIQFLGLPSTITEGLDPERTTANLIPVVAPRDGLVAPM